MIHQVSYETQQLAERLKKLSKEEDYRIVPYSELSKIAGHDVQHDPKGRARLMSARKICERETMRLVGVVDGEGVKLLTVEEQASLPGVVLGKLKRFSRRSRGRLEKVQYDKLNNEQRIEHGVSASILGAVEMFGRSKSIERLRGAVKTTSEKLAIGDTLALFGK
jgi:hypothetical protein